MAILAWLSVMCNFSLVEQKETVFQRCECNGAMFCLYLLVNLEQNNYSILRHILFKLSSAVGSGCCKYVKLKNDDKKPRGLKLC